jgi:hypothetical protein
MNSRQILRAIGELDIVIALAENLRREIGMLYREALADEDAAKEGVDHLAKWPGPKPKARNLPSGGQFVPLNDKKDGDDSE